MTRHKILLKDCDIFDEVDLKKNKDIDFDTLTYRSGKKIWWKCKKDHLFESTCHHRTRGSGCPYCAKGSKIITFEKSLLNLKPKLAKMWHPTKNKNLKPENVSASSMRKKYWFICEFGHEFHSTTNNKRHKTILCSFCSKRLPSKDYNLKKEYPDLTKQWDYKKNLKKPDQYTPKSSHKVWWICIKGHSYKQSIKQRTGQNQGCNICNANISRPQIRIFTEFKSIFQKVELSKIIKKIEIDIYISDIKIGIEYDGKYYHKNKTHKDLEKNKKIKDMGISLIRIREKGLKQIGQTDILLKNNNLQKEDIDQILEKIKILRFSRKYMKKIDDYLDKNEFANNKEFNKQILNLPFPILEKSFGFTHKKICEEWDYKKNKDILPEQFTASSKTKVWWICRKYKHNWEASISDRSYKNAGCRICNENNRIIRFLEINKKRKGKKKEDWPDRVNK
jgi:very-short-patch-repair endonuclease